MAQSLNNYIIRSSIFLAVVFVIVVLLYPVLQNAFLSNIFINIIILLALLIGISFNFYHLINLNYKYISPYIGVISCWKYYLKGNVVGYINFLPLWNFVIFFLLPPKTILGPITGGALYNKSNKINYLIRSIFFPIFYRLSEFALNLRFKNKLIYLRYNACSRKL